MGCALRRWTNGWTPLDRAHLDDIITKYPKSIIRVRRGFMDGKHHDYFTCNGFGYVPNDYDGTVIHASFYMKGAIT